MALGSTQPLTEIGTSKFPGGKGGRCVRLKSLPLSRAVATKSGKLNFLEPSGSLQACNGTAFTHFCQRLSQTRGHSAAGRIMSMKNYSDTIRNRTRDLPPCSEVPQPSAPPRPLSPDGRRKKIEQQQLEMEVIREKTVPLRSALFWEENRPTKICALLGRKPSN
jgi:hypothetical protein